MNDNFNSTVHMILCCIYGQRDALILLKQHNDRLEGEAAALRGNLLNLFESVDYDGWQVIITPIWEEVDIDA